jgi:hypothetical protein
MGILLADSSQEEEKEEIHGSERRKRPEEFEVEEENSSRRGDVRLESAVHNLYWRKARMVLAEGGRAERRVFEGDMTAERRGEKSRTQCPC